MYLLAYVQLFFVHVKEMDLSNVDCWNLISQSCADVPEQCMSVQLRIRNWMIYSNVLYLVVIVSILYMRGVFQYCYVRFSRSALRDTDTLPRLTMDASDVAYCVSFTCVMFASGFYHQCHEAMGANTCYANCYWLNDAVFVNADVLASMISVHATVTIKWIPDEGTSIRAVFEQSYLRCMYFIIPLLVVWMSSYDFVILYIAVTMFLTNLSVRCLLDKMTLVTGSVVGIPLVVVYWTLAASFLLTAFLCEYTAETGMPYTQAHPLWHACTMFASLFFVAGIKDNQKNKLAKKHTPMQLVLTKRATASKL
jgi:hypothetical protein